VSPLVAFIFEEHEVRLVRKHALADSPIDSILKAVDVTFRNRQTTLVSSGLQKQPHSLIELATEQKQGNVDVFRGQFLDSAFALGSQAQGGIGIAENIEPVFLLNGLEVFNWGPFDGKHSCSIDPGGSAIIGPTGSGKTTLIDALMTLLAPFPKYNLASTGGHESDRDLISYVRGVSGVESAQGENDHIARPGHTVTGLAASYVDGSSLVTIGAILWMDDSSSAAEDLKKIWFFAKDVARPLDDLLMLHHEGGRRAVLQKSRETVGLRIFSSKREYLAQVRSFFEVTASRDRLEALTRPNSETAAAKKEFEDARSALETLRTEGGALRESLGSDRKAVETAEAVGQPVLPKRIQGKLAVKLAGQPARAPFPP
jgi:uncharacterized protein YPO0396